MALVDGLRFMERVREIESGNDCYRPYPNPFDAQTMLSYELQTSENVSTGAG